MVSGICRCLLLGSTLAGAAAYVGAALAEGMPVRLTSPEAGIALRVLGRYDGGVYSGKAVQGPPAYDPETKRLFVASQIRREIDILDLGDPSRPTKVGSIGVADLPPGIDPAKLEGGFSSLAYRDGVLAVAFAARDKGDTGVVLLSDGQGHPIAGPVDVGYSPNQMRFLPGGRTLLLANTADPSPTVDPEASLSLIELGKPGRPSRKPSVTSIGFRQFNGREDQLRAAGVRIYTPGASAAQDFEPESLTISEDGRTAWVTLERNNAIAVVDLTKRKVRKLLPLGFRDLSKPGSGIDASDQDGRINIRPWPVHALYEPDWIAAYRTNGRTYLTMANEGDPRPGEEVRVGEAKLDPAAFPNAASLQRPENLGRLEVTRVESDPDRDGVLERLYALGARSFSIRTADGGLVFDSGDAFERVTARAVPKYFNTRDDANIFDDRSDDRGPEPEAVTVGRVAGRQYAFVLFERIGGVIAYDITRPQAARFQEYVNTRNFAVDPGKVCEKDKPKSAACDAAGDLNPESLLFIPAEQSPSKSALLAVRYDLSDTMTIFAVEPKRK